MRNLKRNFKISLIMKFKKLELSGFKSFLTKQIFFIDDGLTGIVGPNGCSKSNIVEALDGVWVKQQKKYAWLGHGRCNFLGTSNRPQKIFRKFLLQLIIHKRKVRGNSLILMKY